MVWKNGVLLITMLSTTRIMMTMTTIMVLPLQTIRMSRVGW